jgi:hypothetical protein
MWPSRAIAGYVRSMDVRSRSSFVRTLPNPGMYTYAIPTSWKRSRRSTVTVTQHECHYLGYRRRSGVRIGP